MPAESARKFDALETQAAQLREVFTQAGFEPVAPSIIQPADIYLERIGEALRSRTYVFTDPDGLELCLRPDLTVPACRIYLERHSDADTRARYFYNGPAFRFSPAGADEVHPREFRQAGIEDIGSEDRAVADADVVALAVEAVRSAGLDNFRLRFGDLGLFDALLDTLDMPERWRHRLRHHFWRPSSFRELLTALTKANPDQSPDDLRELLNKLKNAGPEDSEVEVAGFLAGTGLPIQGARTLAEIAGRLRDRAADLDEDPLPKKTVAFIDDYLSVRAPPKAARARIDDLAEQAGVDLTKPLKAFGRRLKKLGKKGFDLQKAEFQADFGRNLEYYTGFVFQIELTELGEAGQIAGGGRYDTLLSSIGAPVPVPAVGCAIHTERLLAAVQGDLS